MIPIPDHPSGERFCRKCGVFLPLKDFFKGKKRRYECKVHSRGRPRKHRHAPSKKQKRPPCVKKASQSPEAKAKNAVAQVWHAAYTDCRSSFGQATVGMSQAELRELFLASGVAEPSTAFRLVPVDPCRALERGNARLVRREVRIRALRAWWWARRACGGGDEDDGMGRGDAGAAKKRYKVGGEQDEQEGGAGIDSRDAYMAALDERGPDDGAVVEGPGLAMSVDEAAVVEGQQQHDEKGEAEKEELDDDDDDDEDEDDDDDDDEDEEEDEAKTAKEAEAATEAMAMDKTTTGMATAHGDVGA